MGNLQRAIAAFVAVLTVATASLLGPPPVSAQSSYGGESYGTQLYSAEDQGQTGVLPPNTGFQIVVQAASSQPWLFWSSAAAILGAAGGTVWIFIRKRKQEN